MSSRPERDQDSTSRKVAGTIMLIVLIIMLVRGDLHLIPSREMLTNIAWGICVIPPGVAVFLFVMLAARRRR